MYFYSQIHEMFDCVHTEMIALLYQSMRVRECGVRAQRRQEVVLARGRLAPRSFLKYRFFHVEACVRCVVHLDRLQYVCSLVDVTTTHASIMYLLLSWD
jgi:hypothetical protein